jgi:hypothetical protein
MKYLFIIILSGLFQSCIFGQFEKPNVPYQKITYTGDSLPYLWYETDSVREWDNSPYFNEYNKIFIANSVLTEDSFVYCVNHKLEFFDNFGLKGSFFDGMYISKRNLNSGELMWQTYTSHYDAGRQEMPITARINKKGNVEVIGYRRFLPPEDMNLVVGLFGFNDFNLRFFYREFDSETGQVLQHTYPQSEGENVPVLKESVPNNRTRLFFMPGDSTFRYFQIMFNENKFGYVTYLLDKHGQRIGTADTIKTKEYQAKSNVVLTKKGEFLITEIDGFEKKMFFHYYTLDMNWLRTVEAERFPVYKDVRLKEDQSGDYFVFSDYYDDVNPPFFNGLRHYLMDYDGMIVDSLTLFGQTDVFIFTEEGHYFGVQNFRYPSDTEVDQVFRRKKIGQPLEVLSTYKVVGDYRPVPRIVAYSDGKIILRNSEFYKDVTAYRASSAMVVPAEKLGFPVSALNVATKPINWQIAPNPVSDFVHISFDEKQSGQMQVFDMSGSMIWEGTIRHTSEMQLPVFQWNSGLYVIQFIANDGAVASQKIIKM